MELCKINQIRWFVHLNQPQIPKKNSNSPFPQKMHNKIGYLSGSTNLGSVKPRWGVLIFHWLLFPAFLSACLPKHFYKAATFNSVLLITGNTGDHSMMFGCFVTELPVCWFNVFPLQWYRSLPVTTPNFFSTSPSSTWKQLSFSSIHIKSSVSFHRGRCGLVSWIPRYYSANVSIKPGEKTYFMKISRNLLSFSSTLIENVLSNILQVTQTLEWVPGKVIVLSTQTAFTKVNAWNQTNYCFPHIQHHCWSMKETPTLVLPSSPSPPIPHQPTHRDVRKEADKLEAVRNFVSFCFVPSSISHFIQAARWGMYWRIIDGQLWHIHILRIFFSNFIFHKIIEMKDKKFL